MKALFTAIAMVLIAHPAFATSEQAQALVDRAAAECASFENGTFDAGDAVQDINLRAQMGSVVGELVDESAFACSSAASLYCGTGGCMLHLVVQNSVTSWQVTGWQRLDWGPSTILLLGRDGVWCDASGAEVCFEAVTWSNDRWLTVGPEPERQ